MKVGINFDTYTVSIEITDGQVSTSTEFEPHVARLLAMQLISSAEVLENSKRIGLISD